MRACSLTACGVNEMKIEYRQYFFDLRGRLLSGQIHMEEAELDAAPIIAKMNEEARKIANRHGKKFKSFSFAALVR